MTGVSILGHQDSRDTNSFSFNSSGIKLVIKNRNYSLLIFLVAGDYECVYIVLEVKTENDNIGAFIKI